MTITANTVHALSKDFLRNLERAKSLYDRIALSGGQLDANGNFRALRQPDRRDSAQFIFFEVAALFEAFCMEAFRLEVRHAFKVQPARADFIMGNIDKGLSGVMGWASPQRLQERAITLLGASSFFSKIETNVGKSTFDRLGYAHKARNRIAHSSGKAVDDYRKILQMLTVPVGSRQGLSVGRLLMDYPASSPKADRWFFRFLQGYEIFAKGFQAHLVRRLPNG